MATTLAVTRQVKLTGSYTDPVDLMSTKGTIDYSKSKAYTNGTGDSKANMVYTETRTVASGVVDPIDLTGTLIDAFGTTITFTEIKGFSVHNTATATGEKLEVGGNDGAAALINWVVAAGDAAIIGPGGTFFIDSPLDGYAVTATSADILEIKNSGSGSIDYDIVIWGEV